MKIYVKYIIYTIISLSNYPIYSQKDSVSSFKISGSFQADYQKYIDDNSFIYRGLDKKYGLNSYLNLQVQKGKFRAGTRYEAYLPPLISFPQNLDGNGLVNRFIQYQDKKYAINLGHFYEQFGSGIVLRATEQRSLGMDTSIDGISVKLNPEPKTQIKIIGGKQRLGFKHAEGWLYGADLIRENIIQSKISKLDIGLSFIGKNEAYEGILSEIKPNVFVVGGRLNFRKNNFNLNSEFAQKSPDATSFNQFSTQRGNAFLLTSSIDFENFALSFDFKRIQNFDFRSQRGETLNNALINFIPATTKQHSYRLLTLYPYFSQVLGEIGGQIDLIYSFPNGESLNLNFAKLHGLRNNFREYSMNQNFYTDLNLEYEKQWSNNFKTNVMLVYLDFNKGQILGGKSEMVKSFTFVVDATHKLLNKKALRYEIQHLLTKQDLGNWFFALTELSISPHYFLFISNEINYKQFKSNQAIYYPNVGVSYAYKSHRLSMSYGKQREGLLCVGGICRLTPAYTGFSGSITSSF